MSERLTAWVVYIKVAAVRSFVLEAHTSVLWVAKLKVAEFVQARLIAPLVEVLAVNACTPAGAETTASLTAPLASSSSSFVSFELLMLFII